MRHPAYPSLRDVAIECLAERIAAQDEAALCAMRAALIECRARVAKLKFRTGCPVHGYDMPDVLVMLDELTPPEAALEQIESRAWEIASAEYRSGAVNGFDHGGVS